MVVKWSNDFCQRVKLWWSNGAGPPGPQAGERAAARQVRVLVKQWWLSGQTTVVKWSNGGGQRGLKPENVPLHVRCGFWSNNSGEVVKRQWSNGQTMVVEWGWSAWTSSRRTCCCTPGAKWSNDGGQMVKRWRSDGQTIVVKWGWSTWASSRRARCCMQGDK